MLEQIQHGCCALCDRDDKPLIFDHCHASGLLRGLLCRRCNPVEGRDYRYDSKMIAYRRQPLTVLLGWTIPYRSRHRTLCSAASEGGPCQLDANELPRAPTEAARYLARHTALDASCLTLWRAQQGPPRGLGRIPAHLLPAFFGRKPGTVNGWINTDRRGGRYLPERGADGTYDEQELIRWGKRSGVLTLDTALPTDAR